MEEKEIKSQGEQEYQENKTPEKKDNPAPE